MDRRVFLRSSLAAGAAAILGPAHEALALLDCSPVDLDGWQRCEAGIDSRIAAVSAGSGQHLSQWCWAACIEMVFRYYGYRVPQARIVRETWGDVVDMPGRPDQILHDLNRPWIDARGRSFSVSGDVYSANPMTAARDLANDMPLIIGTQGHAMVLTSLQYVRNAFGGGDVTLAIVRDPWPGRGRRALTPEEWYGTSLLIRIRVS